MASLSLLVRARLIFFQSKFAHTVHEKFTGKAEHLGNLNWLSCGKQLHAGFISFGALLDFYDIVLLNDDHGNQI